MPGRGFSGTPGKRVSAATSYAGAGGLILVRGFEIFKDAGGRRAIEKVFHGLTPLRRPDRGYL